MMIQYLGYQPTLDVRSYSFRVVDFPSKEREFAVSIKNSLMSNDFKYQDVPDPCFSKLKHDLALENPESPMITKVSTHVCQILKTATLEKIWKVA